MLKLGYFPTGKVQNFRLGANKFNVLWKSGKSVKPMEGQTGRCRKSESIKSKSVCASQQSS